MISSFKNVAVKQLNNIVVRLRKEKEQIGLKTRVVRNLKQSPKMIKQIQSNLTRNHYLYDLAGKD